MEVSHAPYHDETAIPAQAIPTENAPGPRRTLHVNVATPRKIGEPLRRASMALRRSRGVLGPRERAANSPPCARSAARRLEPKNCQVALGRRKASINSIRRPPRGRDASREDQNGRCKEEHRVGEWCREEASPCPSARARGFGKHRVPIRFDGNPAPGRRSTVCNGALTPPRIEGGGGKQGKDCEARAPVTVRGSAEAATCD